MIVKPWIILVVGLLLLAGTASADPFNSLITVSSDKAWVVANGVDQATISVNVKYASNSTNVPNALVTFNVDSLYGSIPQVTTDANGNAVSTFKVKTKSGVAVITANAEYTDGGKIFSSTTPGTLSQNIDHDSAYKADFVYPLNGTVKSSVPFNTYVLDRWNNPVDNRRPGEIHNLTLHVHGPGADDCGFEDSGLVLHDIMKTLDATGHTSLMVNLTSKPGANTIMTDRLDSMNNQYKTIEAIANGIPYSIVASYSPMAGTPKVPRIVASTNPDDKFTIYYTLYDYFGNPTQNQSVLIKFTYSDGSPDIEETRETEYNGQVWTYYGPKNIAGDFIVTATAVNHDTVTTSQTLTFYNSNPSNLQLSASPQMIASLDANPGIYSLISAKVVDDYGNPVGNQVVTFTISSPQYDCAGNACVDTSANGGGDPSFLNPGTDLEVTGTTNPVDPDFGVAAVKVYPGSFKLKGTSGYSPTATGNATVTATWNGISRDTQIVWKNYPYLSAVTKITPSTVKTGDTVDVNLKLNGDGWALTSKPIDVVLVLDRSGSMAGTDVSPTRLKAAQSAANTFISKMDSSRDRVGLVSYSYPYSVSHDATLQRPFGPVTTAVTGLSASGSTGTRRAVYEGIREAIDHPNTDPQAVRAIILMTDGDFNQEGTPLGIGNGFPDSDYDLWGTPDIATWSGSIPDFTTYKYFSALGGGTSNTGSVNVPYGDSGGAPRYYPGTATYYTGAESSSQNMAVYAQAQNPKIRIYTIGFAGTLNSTSEAALTTLATSTGGFYEYAPDEAKLNEIYTRIAGDLQEEASVDTKAELNFGTILINDAWDSSGDAFEYVGDPIIEGNLPAIAPGSTMIDKYNKTINPLTGSVFHLIPIETGTTIGPIYNNQTPEWNAGRKLSFNIGTVKLHETWETNFRLRVLKEGSYTLFGPDSCISFTDPNTGLASDPFCLDNQSSFTSSTLPSTNPLSHQTITITTPTRTDGGGEELVTNFPVTWETEYSGAPGNEVTVDIYYVHDTDPRVLIRSETYTQGSVLPYKKTLTADFSLASLPVGSYKYHIEAHAIDASGNQDSGSYTYTTSDKNFIKLE